MKKFNESVFVEVSVDKIAKQLLKSFKHNFEHKELVTESIIGLLMKDNRLPELYNVLNGYTNEINFEVGQVVYCNDMHTYHKLNHDTGKYDIDTKEVGNVRIEEIDIYRKYCKIKVYYDYVDSEGDIKRLPKWVSHLSCTKILVQEAV